MNIDSIKNGIVLDHIRAGRGMQIYNSLGLDQLDCSVAIIKNVKSSKMGKKDIIKISDAFEVNFDVLGYIDPEVTVCVIENGSVKSKHKVELPEKIVNIAKPKADNKAPRVHIHARTAGLSHTDWNQFRFIVFACTGHYIACQMRDARCAMCGAVVRVLRGTRHRALSALLCTACMVCHGLQDAAQHLERGFQ